MHVLFCHECHFDGGELCLPLYCWIGSIFLVKGSPIGDFLDCVMLRLFQNYLELIFNLLLFQRIRFTSYIVRNICRIAFGVVMPDKTPKTISNVEYDFIVNLHQNDGTRWVSVINIEKIKTYFFHRFEVETPSTVSQK